MTFNIDKYAPEKKSSEEINSQPNSWAQKIIKIFSIKFNSKEEAIEQINELLLEATNLLVFIFSFELGYAILAGKPFFGFIALLVYGILLFFIKKFNSRIAAILFMLQNILLFLLFIFIVINGDLQNICKFEIIFLFILFVLSWKFIKATFLIHKK